MPLSDLQSRLLNYCEQVYLLEGHLPTYEKSRQVYPELTQNYWTDFFRSKAIRDAFTARGIAETYRGVLTEQQLLVVNTLLDFTDTRSKTRKLSDLQVSSAQYQSWLKDPAFKAYIQQRAENMLPDNTQEAHTALLNSVRNGDVAALKLYYEMTGRWSSKTVGELNVDFLLMKIIEIIQLHVRDEDTLTKIANDLGALTGGGGVAGELPTAQPLALELPVGQVTEPDEMLAESLLGL